MLEIYVSICAHVYFLYVCMYCLHVSLSARIYCCCKLLCDINITKQNKKITFGISHELAKKVDQHFSFL